MGTIFLKFLVEKSAELKESTRKGLQPEFSRLQQLHERELTDVELQATTQERSTRDEFHTRTSQMIDEEKATAKEQLHRLTRDIKSDMEVKESSSDMSL